MSMCLGLCTLSDENIEKVLADPPLIWKVVAPDDPEAYEGARNEPPAGFLSKIFGRSKTPTVRNTDFSLADDEMADTDLDKAWHGIHYMLTGTAWEGEEPLNFLVGGGREVGDIDIGYGPARAFTSKQVQSLNAALLPIDESFLKSRFRPSEMMNLEIYPAIWDRDPAEDDSFGYCAEYFDSLKSFVAHAAERNMGLIVYLT